ncbi:MAG TPA: UDP-N-acetylmuramoyl-tripeptide--D-alanyl-D-alanine ligase [Chthoniobacteraceae bacterium]|nr:UDP-N-acetylmuramoyl-tripeptide--D-alanyl-D-alanine ligase [Chthoniobacteraceae bacterium]
MSLETLARWAGGTLLSGAEGAVASGVATDSRSLRPGDLFVALRGEQFDGHAFLKQAAQAGAVGAVVDKAWNGEVPGEGFGILQVGDTLEALAAMATAYRASLPLKVIGLTGSSGKTSTKDFTAAVLERKFRVVKTQGNFNNHIGLPLSIFRASVEDEVGVFEMGMNHPGEIAPLAAIAAPDLAIITNIGVAHIEFMGSREAIAQEKGMLAEALPPGGTLFMPVGDAFGEAIAARTRAATVFSGIGSDPRAALHAEVLESGLEGSRFLAKYGDEVAEVTLPVAGRHMIENALLALAAGHALGISLEEGAKGLAQCRLTKGRLERKSRGGITFLDDSYNANPESMQAALATFASGVTEGKRIAVLGRMGELGAASEEGHRSVGKAAARARVDTVVAVGDEARWIAEEARSGGVGEVHHLADAAEAAGWLAQNAVKGDLVLIKASRAVGLEKVFDHPAFA